MFEKEEELLYKVLVGWMFSGPINILELTAKTVLYAR
jgi:hypothetical protein